MHTQNASRDKKHQILSPTTTQKLSVRSTHSNPPWNGVRSMDRKTRGDIAMFYERDRSTVIKIVRRAKRRAKRDKVPLQKLSNVMNSPGKHHRPRIYTDRKEKEGKDKEMEEREKGRDGD